MSLTIAEMEQISNEKRKFWFDKSTMNFWGSKIETNPDAENRFISSENNFDGTKRLFTIRQFDEETGGVNDVSGFQQFATLDDAKKALKEL